MYVTGATTCNVGFAVSQVIPGLEVKGLCKDEIQQEHVRPQPSMSKGLRVCKSKLRTTLP